MLVIVAKNKVEVVKTHVPWGVCVLFFEKKTKNKWSKVAVVTAFTHVWTDVAIFSSYMAFGGIMNASRVAKSPLAW